MNYEIPYYFMNIHISYEYSKMSFLSTFTCHIRHHIPLNSNNECSLGSRKGRQITSLHKNHYRIWPQYQPSWPPRYRGGPYGWGCGHTVIQQCFLSSALPRERYPPGRHWSLSIWVKCSQRVAV